MKDVFRSLGIATQVGLTVVASILIPLFLGLWLDDRLGTTPCATLIFVIVGILVGSISTYRLASSLVEQAGLKQEVGREVLPSLKDSLGSLALTAQMGLMLAVPLLVGFFLGLWIDTKLHTIPWAILLLTALGISVGSVGAYRLGSLTIERLRNTKKED